VIITDESPFQPNNLLELLSLTYNLSTKNLLELIQNADNEQLKKWTKQCGNGYYVSHICKGCGTIYTTDGIDGNIENAKIVDRCRHCFEGEV
jgi:hypothetical protein